MGCLLWRFRRRLRALYIWTTPPCSSLVKAIYIFVISAWSPTFAPPLHLLYMLHVISPWMAPYYNEARLYHGLFKSWKHESAKLCSLCFAIMRWTEITSFQWNFHHHQHCMEVVMLTTSKASVDNFVKMTFPFRYDYHERWLGGPPWRFRSLSVNIFHPESEVNKANATEWTNAPKVNPVASNYQIIYVVEWGQKYCWLFWLSNESNCIVLYFCINCLQTCKDKKNTQ